MLLDIDHRSGVPIYRQIINQIRRQIMAGQLPEGQQLVSVRELAENLKVNPMTVSKAYTMLEMEGLLQRQRGVGLFVAKVRRDQKERIREKLIEEILTKAVLTALQFDISEQQVTDITARLFQKHGSRIRSHSHE